MNKEEKSLTPEEVRLALQEYIDAEEEEEKENNKSQSFLLLEEAFKKFDEIPESESFDAVEETNKNKKISSILRLPTYNQLNKNNILEVEDEVFLFLSSIIDNHRINFLSTKKDLFKIQSNTLSRKIGQFFPLIKKKRSLLNVHKKRNLSVFFLNSLISLNIFSTYKLRKSPEREGQFIITFSSRYGFLKKNSDISFFSNKLLDHIHLLQTSRIQATYIQKDRIMQPNYIQQELLINDKKEDILFSLKTFILSFSNNSLTTRIPVQDLFNFLESVNYPIYELVLLLNKLKQQKHIFCWEYFKSHTENYYYFGFFPQKLEEICFLVKSHLEIECFENKTKQINLHALAAAFRVEISKIKECLTVLTIDNYLKVVDKDNTHPHLITIKLL